MMEEVRAYAPGRTELAGNHTDHQGGRVIAAALDCGVEMQLRPTDTGRGRLASEGFAQIDVDLSDVQPRPDELFTTTALVRGVVAGLRKAGVTVGGFDGLASSTVPPGGGLSSSAAFELALASGLCLMAGVDMSPVALARIAQAAERDWFGKACGLMDQLSVALGGIAGIDFSGAEPTVERIGFDFTQSGHALFLVDTHCDHSRYTEDYSQVARDMDEVAQLLGADVLSQVPEEAFLARFGEVRERLGDAAALRGLHFYHENRLVERRLHALRSGDFEEFLRFTRISGASSAQYLQNVSTFDRASQPAMVALALADSFLKGEGACRIHGGGFGGSIQAFVPLDRAGSFMAFMDGNLGTGSSVAFRIEERGACARWE